MSSQVPLVYAALMDLRHGRPLSDDHRPDVRQARDEIRQALGPVHLHAPTASQLVRGATLPRSNLATRLVREDWAGHFWTEGETGYRQLRAQMRTDLGLDAEDLPEATGQ